MDFGEWLKKTWRRGHNISREIDFDNKYISVRALGEWALEELIEDLSYLSNSTSVILDADMLHRDEKRLRKIAVACLGKREVERRLRG